VLTLSLVASIVSGCGDAAGTGPNDGVKAAAAAPAIAAGPVQAASVAAAVSLPVNTYRSFQVTTSGLTDRFMRHQNGAGVTSIIGATSSVLDKIDGTFLIRSGLADQNCYSIESNNFPGSYLRHQNNKIYLGARAGDWAPALFDQDATWCAVAGLAGEGVSLQSKNYPGRYLRQLAGALVLNGSADTPATFASDATWRVTTALTDFAPVLYPHPGQFTGTGVLPVRVAKATFLGKQSSPDGGFARDLGYTGVVNGQIVWTFGDVLLPGLQPYSFCSSDASALGNINEPVTVHDKFLNGHGCTIQWIPLTDAENATGGLSRWAEGGTNVVEYAPNKGLVWFLKNDRSASGGIVGAGVATVTADAKGAVATRRMETLWSRSEPYWGDIGVTFNSLDNNVYVFGHGPGSADLGTQVYLAKVPAARAEDLSAYQYWDQAKLAWTSTRFGDGSAGTSKVTRAQAIFKDRALGQSNAFWSNHYNKWMFVYGADVGYTDIMVMTADRLEGPWTAGFTVASTCPAGCSSIRYTIAPHPEYDPTGKTLLVTWTDSNVIYATRIEWQ
jgi:hypothetical protein